MGRPVLIVTGGTDGADYTAFYTGWTIVADGDGAELYDPAVQAEVQQRILGGRTFEAGLNPFNNPPHLGPAVRAARRAAARDVVPASGRSSSSACSAWLIWRLLTTVAADWSRDERVLLVAASLAAPPLAHRPAAGLVLAARHASRCSEVYLALAGRRRPGGRGVARGRVGQAAGRADHRRGAARRPSLARHRRGRSRCGRPGACAAATVVMGVGIWTSYLRFLGDYVGSFDVFSVRPSVMWNLRGTLTLLTGPTISTGDGVGHQHDRAGRPARGARRGRLAVARALGRRRAPPFALRFALTLVLGLLLSPHLNPHDDLLLVPAGAIAYGAVP